MAATSDLEVSSDTPGYWGNTRVRYWDDGRGSRTVYVQLNKPYPQTIRIRSNTMLEDLGEFTTQLAPIDPTTFHAVPTENAKVIVSAWPPGTYQQPYYNENLVIPLASLAAEGGYEFTLALPPGQGNPSDLLGFQINPIYIIHERNDLFPDTSHEHPLYCTIALLFYPPSTPIPE